MRGENYGRVCDVWSVGCVIIEMIIIKFFWNAKDILNYLVFIFKVKIIKVKIIKVKIIKVKIIKEIVFFFFNN